MGDGIIKYLKDIFDNVLSVLFSEEEQCPLCEKVVEKTSLCLACRNKIDFINEVFVIRGEEYSFKGYSVGVYSNAIVGMIKRFKYSRDFQCGRALGELLKEKILHINIESPILTFVPMSSKSYKKRGYNQSEYLAKVVGRELNIPVVNTLYKCKETLDQIGLNGNERWSNVDDSFKLNKGIKIENRKIIIIDDVITTGATAYNCGKELMKNGAKEINILTVAKSNV